MSDILSNTLADIAESIREASEIITSAERTSVEHAHRAGFLLCQAKEECGHGEWLPFLERACVSERKAQRWMKIARAGLKPDTVSDLGGVRAALDYIAKLVLPERGDILFISAEADEGSSLRCAWIEHSAKYDGCYQITAIRHDELVLTTVKPPKGDTFLCPDGYFNGVWVCLDEMTDIPHDKREFVSMPEEMLEKDDFAFLELIHPDEDFPSLMPASYEHAIRRLKECIDDYSLDRAKAAWRAVRALCAKLDDWPHDPRMAPVYRRIVEAGEITLMENVVRSMVRARNPEIFEEAQV